MKIGKADLGVALYLLCAFVFLIIPIPSTLLDICLALNMSVAFAIMFNSMFAKEVLDMSFYPTMLLFTTLFRISLNISSTRLILTFIPFLIIWLYKGATYFSPFSIFDPLP